MTEVRITCINKSHGNHANPHEAVTNYGWVNPTTSETGMVNRTAMVQWIEQGNYAYVQDRLGNKAYCTVRESTYGNKFLQTISDNKYTDNLLSLLECRT